MYVVRNHKFICEIFGLPYKNVAIHVMSVQLQKNREIVEVKLFIKESGFNPLHRSHPSGQDQDVTIIRKCDFLKLRFLSLASIEQILHKYLHTSIA